MARIRSIHPGLFTDETFVTLSDAAKVFYLGLLTEADDFGAFEWKPVTLKMRLMPASTSLVEPLLEELRASNKVAKYEHGGRAYGAIRNFCRYQRPKKPKSIYFMPPEFRTYVASSEASTEPIDDEGPPVPQKSEIAPQMEDGGGSRKKQQHSEPNGSAPAGAAAVDARTRLFRDGLRMLIDATGKREPQARALIGQWLKFTGDDCVTVTRLIEDAHRDRPAEPIAWIEAHFRSRQKAGTAWDRPRGDLEGIL